jgi:hypothetical protein
LIDSEQGFGDALHFARYARLVRSRSGAERVILETRPELARLFAQNRSWDAEIVAGFNSAASTLPPFDRHVPLLGLPLALGLLEPLPMSTAYLRADPALRGAWSERLGRSTARRIGLAWAGNAVHPLVRLRSMPAEQLRPLLQLDGLAFYSLQIGRGSEAESLKAAGLVDLTQHLTDFAETAALISELDLIISVDTAIVHLAGAIGCPVWTLLSHPGDWRWGLAGETTAWYPTMRLFRQTVAGDWEAVVQRVVAELANRRDRF